ncbi:MAG: hypothetical protein WEC59_01190 [Salibacteraceae bacterium]
MTYKLTINDVITQGGDERIELKANGLNKYYVNPLSSVGHLNRGSCTCSPLSEDVRTKVTTIFKQLINEDISVEDVRIKQRFRIKALLQDSYTDDFNIFFAPSGSDLCYFPLMFAQIKNPDKPILSLTTCPEELGTGSILANTGRYFSEKTQIKEKVEKGLPLKPSKIDHILFPARDKNGSINNHKKAIYEAIEKHRSTHQIIVNLVIGSKSGIEDNMSIIEDGPKDVTWVVDLCQMRATPKLFNDLLSLNCLLMITGSKFYQSPPFCGALLVPENYADDIVNAEVNKSITDGYDSIYSKFDIPPSYKKLRNNFKAHENYGLTLRWEAAICESELLTNYSEREINYAISTWNKQVKEYLEHKEMFSIMVDQEVTNRSIVSFLISRNGHNLTHDQLKLIYEHLCLHGHRYFPKYDRISIGQPVAYETHSFLRLALGSNNVRALINCEVDLTDDFKLIDTLEEITHELFG